MSETNKLPDLESMVTRLLKEAESYAAVSGLNFFKESFEKQGWTGTAFEPWQARTNDLRPGGAILMDSGQLRDSLQILERGDLKIKYGTFSPYASIHNHGGVMMIPITKKSRKYFWYMYYRTKKELYRGLALTKKKSVRVQMPKRQFIGHSDTLMIQLDDWILNRIITRFKEI
ncbi:hypothetical protein ETU08_01835 [Apibacter muscae]|uniref:Uncharacterized protein n=1 Tax=Apibacter muscae TaxID=2509004 RepID=A0A563DJZ6_9FLAO|nr:phage virion morphogenesis protein [Apibacter muscae]TWP30525.1 hypothetical protein ETU09_00560 [Apibacter muscae]TWP31246.1 hypothetical protein ETU08_01835 [Apibacter muscae]